MVTWYVVNSHVLVLVETDLFDAMFILYLFFWYVDFAVVNLPTPTNTRLNSVYHN